MDTAKKLLRGPGRGLFVAIALLVLSGTVEVPFVSSAPLASAAALPWENPVPTGTVSDVFGSRGGAHAGIDIAARYEDPVNAPADLKITNITIGGRYGTLIEAVSSANDAWTFRIAHCTLGSVNALSIGQQFARGTRIADIGTEGDATGPHVHFELLYQGKLVNPNILLEGQPGPDWMPDPVPAPTPKPVDPLIEALHGALDPLGIPIPFPFATP